MQSAPFSRAAMSDLNGAVAVAIGLDNGHQPGSGTGDAAKLPDIMRNGL